MTSAMRLVAEQGYDAASVGAIEQEAGLAPRSGALYKHFRGKHELLRAAIEREMRAVDELDAVVEMLPLGDLRAELTLLARWNLSSLALRPRIGSEPSGRIVPYAQRHATREGRSRAREEGEQSRAPKPRSGRSASR